MATLKISDLSVGDWVEFHPIRGIYIAPPLFDHANAQVVGTHRGAEVSLLVDGKREFMAIPLSAIRPIPITAEILEKNGFESSSSCWIIYKDNGGHMEIWEDGDRWYLSVNSVEFILCDLHWVHQIQHLMRVWGFDKEINL